MTEKIEVVSKQFAMRFGLIVEMPNNVDICNYIDSFLKEILDDEFEFSCTWSFV